SDMMAVRADSGASVRIKPKSFVPVKGASTMRVGRMVEPLTRSTFCTTPGAEAAGTLGRVAPRSIKGNPEEEPCVVSSFLIGTRDEFRTLLSTRYWPKLDAANDPVSDPKSFREAVKVSALAS